MSLRCILFWDFIQRGMIILYQHFGTPYQPHLQDSNSPLPPPPSPLPPPPLPPPPPWDCLTLKLGLIGFPKCWYGIIILSCLKTQKGEDRTYNMEA